MDQLIVDDIPWELARDIYSNVVVPSFLHEGTVSTPDALRPYVEKGLVSLCAVYEGDVVAAACVYSIMHDSKALYILYIATSPDYRRRGLAQLLYDYLMKTYSPPVVCIEVDVSNDLNGHCDIKFWNSLKFRSLPFEYVQPALTPLDQEVGGMRLAVNCDKAISTTYVRHILTELFHTYYLLSYADTIARVKYLLRRSPPQLALVAF